MPTQNRTFRVTDEQAQMVLDLLPVVSSFRQLALATGLNKTKVGYIAAPYLAIMRATGAIGYCECGRERFHPRVCSRTLSRGGRVITPKLLAHRAEMVAAIMSGEQYLSIARRYGVDKATVRAYLRYLTPAQRERRKALERARIRESRAVPVVRPHRDALYRRVYAALPGWLDDTLRDDVASEMLVAIYEGAEEREIIAQAERFARAARNAFASKFGAISLDQPLFDGSRETIGSSIVDPGALAAFDYIFEERI